MPTTSTSQTRERPTPRVPPVSADPVDVAFAAYIKAARQAQGSLDIRDGVEAGRRWGTFVRLFEGRD